MCDFIFATLDRKADVAALRPLFERHGFSLGDVLAASAGEILFRPTNGHCDCGTVLGSATRGTTPEKAAERFAAEVARLEKEGWSRTKIQRWRKQREAEGSRERSQGAEVARWLQLLTDVPAQPRVTHVGLAVQSFSGAVEPSALLAAKARRVPWKDVSETLLGSLENGVLHRFVKNDVGGG